MNWQLFRSFNHFKSSFFLNLKTPKLSEVPASQLQLFFVVCEVFYVYFGVLDFWLNKTSNLRMTLINVGNCDCDFSLFPHHFIIDRNDQLQMETVVTCDLNQIGSNWTINQPTVSARLNITANASALFLEKNVWFVVLIYIILQPMFLDLNKL